MTMRLTHKPTTKRAEASVMRRIKAAVADSVKEGDIDAEQGKVIMYAVDLSMADEWLRRSCGRPTLIGRRDR